MSSLQAPLFFGLTAAFITSLGLLAVALRADWSARNADLFGLAAGGMLVTLTLLHIAPEAFALASSAPGFILAGFLGGLLLNQSTRLMQRQSAGVPARNPADALTPVLAIAIHSFIDGVIYAVTFATSFESGVYAAISLILHEFPEGVIAFAILRAAGASNRNAFIWAFLAAAATTPLGVAVSGPFMFSVGEETLGQLFALSAGLLLFVATGPLLAPARVESPTRSLAAIAAGVVVAMAVALAPFGDHHGHQGHDHGDHEHHIHEHIDSRRTENRLAYR
ncbi:MAG: ZIP family metal transporter [Hyphomonadaceae bacterium]|nr:ZIP family metal transporter [Hyphomonadaceae bacterium]